MIEGGSRPLCFSALTGFLALVMDGSIPLSALCSSLLLGADYCSLAHKKDGGVRPIAVGLTLTDDLAAKIVAKAATTKACSTFLAAHN